MDWKENINKIKEIFPGQFQIVLDFATNKFIKLALSSTYKYVWVSNHKLPNTQKWQQYSLPLFSTDRNFSVIARQLSFEFVMETQNFIDVLPFLEDGITIIQMNHLPNDYLDINRLKGKTLYDLLTKECDYLFELNIPSPTDYGTIVSPDKKYLQSLLENPNINWGELP